MKESLEVIKESDTLKYRWNIYARKNKYAKDITFKEIVKIIDELIHIIETM